MTKQKRNGVKPRPKSSGLADFVRVVRPRARWSDLVLPSQQFRQLEKLVFHAKVSSRAGGSALFVGPDGTGRTLAVEVVASELGLPLYRVDLAAVVSKYIGETEKNLRQLFDAAEAGGGVLFFDEADALFGKRTSVRDSHDRYANIEVSYLRQRIEGHLGLVILATNMKANLDPAFTRRLRFIVEFPTRPTPPRSVKARQQGPRRHPA